MEFTARSQRENSEYFEDRAEPTILCSHWPSGTSTVLMRHRESTSEVMPPPSHRLASYLASCLHSLEVVLPCGHSLSGESGLFPQTWSHSKCRKLFPILSGDFPLNLGRNSLIECMSLQDTRNVTNTQNGKASLVLWESLFKTEPSAATHSCVVVCSYTLGLDRHKTDHVVKTKDPVSDSSWAYHDNPNFRYDFPRQIH